MKYRKTTWEYKNLGVSSCEIILEKKDTVEGFQKLDESISEEYRVLKVPTNMPDFLFGLAKRGYIFVETQIMLSIKREDFTPIAAKNTSYEKIQWEEIDTPEAVEQLAFLKDGNTFLTDRIAIDPLFGCETAGLRYFNWLQDICLRGGSVVLVKVDGRLVSFNTIEMDSAGVCHGALFGMVSPPYEDDYYACMDAGLRYIFDKRGAKRVDGAVSSNNMPVLRLHQKMGNHVKGLRYVYVKHEGGMGKKS